MYWPVNPGLLPAPVPPPPVGGGGGGGSGTPGGSDTQVQFNQLGAFAGSPDLTWDNVGKVLYVDGRLRLAHQAIAPTPDDGDLWTTSAGLHVRIDGETLTIPKIVPAQAANTVYAGPATGPSASPTFRALVAADLPLFTSSLRGAVPPSGGGTTTYLRADGTWATPAGGGGSAIGGWDFYYSWSCGADTGWKKIADITAGTGLYTGAAYDVEVIDSDTDQGAFLSAKVIPFVVRVTRSLGVQDDANDAGVSGGSADYIRVVKTATGVYELQFRSPNPYKNVSVRARLNHKSGTVTTTWQNLTAISAGTTYTAVNGHTHVFPWISATRLTNLATDGFVRTSNTDGTLYVDTASYAVVGHTHTASDISSGTFSDARIAQTNVTQHQAALSIGWGQLSGVPGSFTPSAHVLDSATHTISGKTAGQVLLATAATAFAFTSISGDATLAGTGALTLASTIAAAGPVGGAATVPVITFDAKGRLTAVTTAAITPAAIGAQPLDSDLTAIAALVAPGAPGPGLRNVIVHNGTSYVWDVVDAQGTAYFEAGAAVTAHEGLADPHPQYLTATEGSAAYQPLDADLTAIAGLSTTGILARTAADTWATRTINGTTGQITVDNGDGVSANPTISLPATITAALTWTATQTFQAAIVREGTSSDTGVVIRANAGTNRLLYFQTGTSNRWAVFAGSGAESGANAGTAFNISAYDDAGAFIDTPFSITRAASGGVGIARPLTITNNGATSDTNLFINGTAGYNRAIYLRTGASNRWSMFAGTGAESGSDAGSAFSIGAFTDAGAFIDSPITITRASGGTITVGGTSARFTNFTGNLGVYRGAGVAALMSVSGQAGQAARTAYETNAVGRWQVGRNGDAESGSDAGSAFVIGAFSDAGTFIDWPLTITRAAGGAAAWTRRQVVTIGTSTQPAIALSCTGGNGAGILFQGDGATTPNKTIRVNGGQLQVINDAYTLSLFSLTDTGDLSLAGELNTPASTTARASLNIPHGTAPTTPGNGDVWTTTAGLFARINGVTVGPFSSTAGTVTGSGANTRLAYWDGASSLTSSANLTYDGAAIISTTAGATTEISSRNTSSTGQAYFTTYNNSSQFWLFTIYGSSFAGTTYGATNAGAAYLAANAARMIIGPNVNVPIHIGSGTSEIMRFDGGTLASHSARIYYTTASTTTSTGALILSGGLGLTGAINGGSTIRSKGANAGIQLNHNSATGAFDISLVPANLTGNRTITFADVAGTVTLGTGTANRPAYWSATNTVTSSANWTYDGTSMALSVTNTSTSGTVVLDNRTVTLNPTAISTTQIAAQNAAVTVGNGATTAVGTAIAYSIGAANTRATATLASLQGINIDVNTNPSSGTTTEALGVKLVIRNTTAGHTITTATGLQIPAFTATGTITNRYAIDQQGSSDQVRFAGRTFVLNNTAATTSTDGAFVVTGGISGGAALVTAGSHSILATAADVGYIVSASAGQYRTVRFQTAGVARWILTANNEAETGSDAGTTFGLNAYTDAGGYIDSPLYFVRASGGGMVFGGSTGRPATFGGNVAINRTGSQATYVFISRDAGQKAILAYRTGTGIRWEHGAGNIAESGSNAGSDFELNSYDDAGAYAHTPLQVVRSSGLFRFQSVTATTAAVDTVAIFRNNSTGTPAAGYGSHIVTQLKSSTTSNRDACYITTQWADATDASRKARLIFQPCDTAAREALRLEASGSAALIGFLGAAAAARQSVGNAATDAATTQTLANNLRAALITLGLCQT